MLTNLAPAGGRKELSVGDGSLKMFFYSIFAFLFITVLPPVIGLKSLEVNIILSEIAKSVGIFLGIQSTFLVIYFLIMKVPLMGVFASTPLINPAYWSKKKYFKPSLINI